MANRCKVAGIVLLIVAILVLSVHHIQNVITLFVSQRKTTGPEKAQTVRSLDPGPPHGYIQLNHTYYKFVTSKTFWMNARYLCVKDGGDLVTIESKDKHDILAKQASTLIGSCATPTQAKMAAFWLGACDIEAEGTHRWSRTQQVVGSGGVDLWLKGDPNNYGADGEDCLAMANYGGDTWDWIDYACGIECCYICEITRT